MVANEKLKYKGYEVMLFPLDYMNISQDEYGSYSHSGILAIDFIGRTNSYPYYAPCTSKLVYQSQTGAYNIWESINRVRTPIGLTYITYMVIHDNNLMFNVGDIVSQGVLIGHTGTGGVATGDHVHLNTAYGKYIGQEQIEGNWQLKNSEHIYNICYVNNTEIVNGMNHDWKTFTDGGISSRKNNKFNFILFNKNKRI